MLQINKFLEANYNCLLIAPTGWGKTTLLLDLIARSAHSWIYLSPLRALCNEFFGRAASIPQSFAPKTQKEVNQLGSFKLLILTPELCTDKVLFSENSIWVFDEFHLFLSWGESFRRKIIDLYETITHFNRPVLLLSATIDEKTYAYWGASNGAKLAVNLGNHQIKKYPFKRIWYLRFHQELFPYIQGEHSTLIFCQYRSQVKSLECALGACGHSVISCLGGESHLFAGKLELNPKPDFILGTSSLSHGVNLPKISRLIINYPVKDFSMWTQMVGRAGRKGEEFILYSQDSFRMKLLGKLKCLCWTMEETVKLRVRRWLNEF